MKQSYEKKPRSLREQLALLHDRGLRIAEPALAREALRRVNYYRFSAYWRIFRNEDDTFREDGSFEQALELYEFDRQLRLLCLDMIERVEVALRCEVAYRLGLAYGTFAHEKPTSLRAGFGHARWLAGLHDETTRSQETFVRHFEATYDGFPALPIWVACEIMSFGTLSRLVGGLKTEDCNRIAMQAGIKRKVFASWMHSIVNVRNICAHHGRLWNRELGVKPRRPAKDPRWGDKHVPRPGRVYAVLCILRDLSRRDPCGAAWARRVVALLAAFPARFLRMTGAPANWAEGPFWRGLGR